MFGKESRWLDKAGMSVNICWSQERVYGSKQLRTNTWRGFTGNHFAKLTDFDAPKYRHFHNSRIPATFAAIVASSSLA